MIYITGDTHIPIDIKKLSAKKFPEQKNLTKKDYVIICGDFGGVWDGSNEEKYWISWLKEKSFTTLFVDGNHENFDMLSNLPEEEFCGGKIHKVDEGIYHLMRGMIYNIDMEKLLGKKVYVENDANAAAWGEYLAGSGKGSGGSTAQNRWPCADSRTAGFLLYLLRTGSEDFRRSARSAV